MFSRPHSIVVASVAALLVASVLASSGHTSARGRGSPRGRPAVEAAVQADGVSWHLLPSPTREPITQLFFISLNRGWLITEAGRLFEFGGEGWKEMLPPAGEHVERLFAVSDNDLWCASSNNRSYVYFIRRSQNGRWTDVASTSDRILDFAFSSAESGWAVGENGLILRYDGRTWVPVPSPTLLHLRRVSAPSANEAWAVGEYRDRGAILHFDGKRWSEVTPFALGELSALVFPSAEEGWAGGRAGLLRYQNSRWLRVGGNPPPQGRRLTATIESLTPLPNGDVVARLGDGATFVFEYGRWRRLSLPPGVKGFMVAPASTGKVFIGVTIATTFPSEPAHRGNGTRAQPRFSLHPFPRRLDDFGVGLADLDLDGSLEIYLVNHERENALFRLEPNWEGRLSYANRADEAGLLAPVQNEAGTNFYDSSVVFGDVDNDGYVDLFLASLFLENKLYRNLGGLRFRDISDWSGVGSGVARSNGACFGDVDNDGDLDLFVTNFHSSNRLYLNNGTGRFSEETSQVGLETERGGVGATFGDIDNDGDLDLFVATWGGPNLLFENLGVDPKTGRPRFVENGRARGLTDSVTAKRSQGAVFGDIDNDGDLDLFVTNVVTTNRLYRNDGTGSFVDITREAGVTDSARSNSANFFDADNDGDLDLFVANRGRNRIYANLGDGTFQDVSEEYGLAGDDFSVGSATGDLDGDGDLDLVVANYNARTLVLDNGHDRGDFLKLRLVGVASNRDAIGARAYLYPAGKLGVNEALLGMREVCAGSGYYSMSSTEVHFGVRISRRYDVRVTFPSGISRELRGLEPGQSLTVEELKGWEASRIRLEQWLHRLSASGRARRVSVELAILFILLFGVHLGVRRRYWWERKSSRYLYLVPIAAFLAAALLFRDNEGLVRSAAVYLGTLAALAWALHSARQVGQSSVSEKYREELLLACSAFEHGEWAAKALTRLQFLLRNLEPDQRVPSTVSGRICAAIADYHDLLTKELKHIISLAQLAGLQEAASVLRHQQVRLSDSLGDARVGILLGRGVPNKIVREVLKLVDGLREQIRLMRSETGASLYCRIGPTLERVARKVSGESGVEIQIRPKPIPDVWVRIRTPELVAILDNLFGNAVAAMDGEGAQQVCVGVSTDIGCVTVEFSDSGVGLPRDLWERVFDPGFSTFHEGHAGFGLYFARETLRRYGGSIEVKSSSPGKGTTFVMTLKRFNHE